MSSTDYSSLSAVELLQACAGNTDERAWVEFVVRFHCTIALSVWKVLCAWRNRRDEVVDDFVQETYLKLCGDGCSKLIQFAIKHPELVPNYISSVASNVAHDGLKSLLAAKRGGGNTDQLTSEMDPTPRYGAQNKQSETERRILLQEVDRCLENCTDGPERERDCLIFRLHYQQGFSAKAIAALPHIGLTPKGVEAVLHRLTVKVREQLTV